MNGENGGSDKPGFWELFGGGQRFESSGEDERIHSNRHHNNIYQHQGSVNSQTSMQTVIFNNTSMTHQDGNACGSQLMASDSLNSILTRSTNSNGSQKQKTLSISSAEEPLYVGDVAELLHPQYGIISGGRSREGSPIITFPDHLNFHLLSDRDYQRLILYLISVTSLQDADLGFHLVIDRRKDRWASVKTVLLKISCYFPGLIHAAYVLRPSGFFQKAISEVSSKFFKDEFRFKVVICASIDELYDFLPKHQLTADLGGELFYSHHEWIQQRILLEKFSGLTNLIACNLEAFMRNIHDTEVPNSVEATEQQLIVEAGDYSKLKDEILSAGRHGENLLAEIRKRTESAAERIGNISSIERAENTPHLNVHNFDNSRDIRRLLVQLEETERRFDIVYKQHRTELECVLELRRFEVDFRELQVNFNNHLTTLSDMTEIGDTTVRMDQIMKESKAFEKMCQEDMETAEEVIAKGRLIIESYNIHSKDTVKPKCDELCRITEMFSDKLNKRLETLVKARDLMERVENANEWCANGIELLASQRIETYSVSIESAEIKLQEILKFIASADDYQLSELKNFKTCFEESTSLETIIVSQVLQRIDDVTLMCEKRVATLKKLATKPMRPVQTVTPEPAVPLQPNVGAPLLRSRKGSTRVQIESFITRPMSSEGPADSGISVSGDHVSSPDGDSLSIQSQTDIESRRLKRGHVLAELLETERIYVSEMGSILKGYCDELLSEKMASVVPPGLQGKADILFGNLHELYTFHSETFLKDLENCISTTELVALCFVQRRDVFFRLYSYYCQNIPRSERLRETLVDTHLFLQECQKKLGHKLPLAAYLLKPVQRITKYQLLLKDLLRFSESGTCTRELQKALDCMLVVLKCVNDSMHQIAITGFPADLSQQGDLLLQDSFQLWTESKKDMRLRMKTQHRHIFLYQKAMLFCKQGSKTGHNKSTYQFKHWLKMSQIGLTESVRGDPRRFEVWLNGRQEVHTIQAATIEIKSKWVSEIKRVLLNQLEELKDEKNKQYGVGGPNHKSLRQTNSYDMPITPVASQFRAMSVDHSSEVKRNPTPPINEEGQTTWNSTGISASSSEHDNQETNAWSSDYSNSEDEYTILEEGAVPGSKFLALADYCAMGHSEVSMKEGDTVELLKMGCAGWWFCRVLNGTDAEGWLPRAYLLESTASKKPSTKLKSRTSIN